MNNEEQYKHIEQKIVEAANHNEYSFSEESWKRMELLLDKKDKKRRFFFWVLPVLLLLIVGGGIILYKNNSDTNKTYATANKQENTTNSTLPQVQRVAENDNVKNAQKDIAISGNISTKKDADTVNTTLLQTPISQTQQYGSITKQNVSKNIYTDIKSTTNKPASKKSALTKTSSKKDKRNNDEELFAENKVAYQANKKAKVKVTTPALGEENWDKTKAEPDEVIKEDQVKEIESEMPEIPKPKDKTEAEEVKKSIEEKEKESTANTKPEDKKNNKKTSQFFVVTSLGVEANTTKLLSFNNTKIVPRYGASIGYQFNDRLSVQTGFYVSGKKYIAQKNQYKFPPNSYWNYVDITKVDATCRVYEIPLSVQYNFIRKPKLNIFGSVGVSSFIMKREDYVYSYWYNNVFYNTPHSYTKNTHLLAVSNFSLGIEKSITSKIGLQFAPRISVPLGGVGEGKVKLFSSGIDFGIKYYPFKK